MRKTEDSRTRTGRVAWGLALLLAAGLAAQADEERNEVPLSAADYQKLDTFEGVLLSKGDKVFANHEFRRAAAEYDGFVLQYPKSIAVPYALLRKGRSLQRDNKRFDAIKVYNEVLDYFPNAADYAGAALYYIGESNWQNGDAKAAMKAWAEMAQDADYRKHFLAAGAINQLADNLVRQDKWSEAVAYYQQVSVDFRRSNPPAALAAIGRLLECYVRVQPDEPKLWRAYQQAEGFEPSPRTPEPANYWWRVMEAIDRYDGDFAAADRAGRMRFLQYWAHAMEGKFPEWDDFQINLARYQRTVDGDTTRWMQRLDTQFEQHQKPGDYSRIIKWIGLFAPHRAKVDAYYARLAFDKMSMEQIAELIRTLYQQDIDKALARHTIERLPAEQTGDDARENLARWIWQRDEEGVRLVCAGMHDADRGRMTMLRYYRDTSQADKALKAAEDLVKVPQYAREVCMIRGEMFQQKHQWADAVAAYRQADFPPESLYRIASCLLSDGKREAAIGQYREIEGFFVKEAPEAALRIAYAYRDTGDQKQYVAALRAVLKKYPTSGQSSAAHLELERLGFKIGGGIDAE